MCPAVKEVVLAPLNDCQVRQQNSVRLKTRIKGSYRQYGATTPELLGPGDRTYSGESVMENWDIKNHANRGVALWAAVICTFMALTAAALIMEPGLREGHPRRLSENEIVFSRSRKAKIITTGAPQEVPLG